MSVHVWVCVRVTDRQTESAKSYNCGSVLQAQSPVPAPLIQHTHCTFSRSMIPLCLTHNLSLLTPSHTHIYPPRCTNWCAHAETHMHSILLTSPSFHSCPASRIYMCSQTPPLPFPSSFSFHPSFSLKPWAITHRGSREDHKWEGRERLEREMEGQKDGKSRGWSREWVKEISLSLTTTQHLKTSALQRPRSRCQKRVCVVHACVFLCGFKGSAFARVGSQQNDTTLFIH